MATGALASLAQPTCAIDIGPDRTICQGQSALLTGPTGFTNHLWSTGATSPSISVNTTGTYWCQVSYPSGNLVVNGTFAAGNTAFWNQFNYSPDLWNEPNYFIGQNASWFHNQFAAVGNGNFLMVNAGWQHAWWDVWCQNVPVCPGQTYTLSFRGCSLSNGGSPVLEWYVDGNYAAGQYTVPPGPGAWQTFNTTWTAPPGMTSADFCLKIVSGHGVGNDLGLDDISISTTVVLRDSLDVTVTPLPVVDLGNDTTLCGTSTLTLDASVPGGSYTWLDGTITPTYTVTGPGTYAVQVTANNCTALDNIVVNYQPLPPVDLGNDLALCDGDLVVLDATLPGATYLWQDGTTAPTFQVTGPGTYAVQVTRAGCSNSSSIQVDYAPLPVVDLGPDIAICSYDVLILDTGLPGAIHLWQDGTTASTYHVQSSGTYVVEVTVGNCMNADQVQVTVNDPPTVDLGPDVDLCQGQTVTFDLTGTASGFLWSNGSTDPSITTGTAGFLQVEVTTDGCSATDEVEVTVAPVPVVDLGADRTICAGTPLTLDAFTPGATYLWSNGSTDPQVEVTTSGTYGVEVTLGNCSTQDAATITVTPLPQVDLGPDRWTCPGSPVTFDATTPGATYLWNNGSTDATLTTDMPGTYAVEVTVNGCPVFDEITLAHFNLQAVDLGPDIDACVGTPVPLTANVPGAQLTWSTGATGPSINATGPGWYWLDATMNGCTVRDSVLLTFHQPPVVDLGADPAVCPGSTVLLNATTPGASYVWSNGQTGPTVTVGPGTWSVTVTVGPCAITDQVTVQQRVPPSVDLGIDTTLCPGSSLTYNVGSAGSSALWNDGSTALTRVISTAGLWSVTVTDGWGCSAQDQVQVAVAVLPQLDLGPDTTLCAGSSIVVDATTPGATSYLWNNGSGAPVRTLSGNGTFSVTAMVAGCPLTDAIQVTTVAAPPVDLGPDLTLCPGGTTVLDPGLSGFAHLWQNGSGASQFTVNSAGLYWVEVTNGFGCSDRDSVLVTYVDPLVLDLGNDTTLCPGQSLTLSVPVPNASIVWSTGTIGPTITVATDGTYEVDVSIGPCSFQSAITVDVADLPSVDLGGDQQLCAGATTLLSANTNNAATLLWDDGSSAAQRSVGTGGVYWVEASLAHCTSSDTVVITGVPLPTVHLGNDTVLCPGDLHSLNAATPGASYLWNNGSTAPGLNVGAGNWSVTVTVQGCSASDAVSIVHAPVATFTLPTDTLLCDGATWTANAAFPGATQWWQDGSTASSFTISEAGTYTVQSTLGACSVQHSIQVGYVTPVPVDLGADTLLCPGAQLPLSVQAPNAQVTWSNGQSGPGIVVTSPGTYQVVVDLHGCLSDDTIEVGMVQLATPELGDPRMLCSGDSILLVVHPAGADVLWNNGQTTDSVIVRTGGPWSVQFSSQGCTVQDMVWITERPMITEGPLAAERTICFGHTLTLDASIPEATYQWSNGSTYHAITVTYPGTYHYQAEGPCILVQDTVELVAGNCTPLVHVPNAFTPDGDGLNDRFAPITTGTPLEYDFLVFDRWGGIVFESRTPGEGWDGLEKGEEAPIGVYSWRLIYRAVGEDGIAQSDRIGSVTLIR